MEYLLKLVAAAAIMEKMEIIKNHGRFHSLHEGYAVCREEYEEAVEELKKVRSELKTAWSCVREDDENGMMNQAFWIKKWALNCAAECIQVAAVAEKFMEGIDERKLL